MRLIVGHWLVTGCSHVCDFWVISLLIDAGRMRPTPRRGEERKGTSLDPKSLAFLRRSHIAFTCAAAVAICRRERPIPFDRTSDGVRISSQIPRSFLFDPPRLSARRVPSPFRKSCCASIRLSSVVRFVSLAFPYPSTSLASALYRLSRTVFDTTYHIFHGGVTVWSLFVCECIILVQENILNVLLKSKQMFYPERSKKE